MNLILVNFMLLKTALTVLVQNQKMNFSQINSLNPITIKIAKTPITI